MTPSGNATLKKAERLHGLKAVEALFKGGAGKSMTAFPLRLVYRPIDPAQPSQMLVSVPKRCFKQAVRRNRVKRQVREAYRHSKDLLPRQSVAMAFIWMDRELRSSAVVNQRVRRLMTMMAEKLSRHIPDAPDDNREATAETDRP
jgi:ribonuclease P protein component